MATYYTSENIKSWGKLITDEQIDALRIEAGEAGDDRMIELCRAAKAGDELARGRCYVALADAAAQADSE